MSSIIQGLKLATAHWKYCNTSDADSWRVEIAGEGADVVVS